jgi:hypothetical protein
VPATPDPTVAAPTVAAPTDAPATVAATAELVLHLTTASDTGAYGPGTTILDDRRIIWADKRYRPIESRLGREALAEVRAALQASDALDKDVWYGPELRPGKQHPGHGASFHVFDIVRDGEHIVVSVSDPASFEGEDDIYVIPPEMHELTDLAHRIADPLAWLGPDAFVEPIRPYEGGHFLVEIHLFRGTGGSVPDVDTVRWPFGEPIEDVGVFFEAGGDPESRCLFLDATTASEMVLAEQNAGVDRDIRAWSSTIDYEWPRVGGWVMITLTHLLPYESGTCAELATRFR